MNLCLLPRMGDRNSRPEEVAGTSTIFLQEVHTTHEMTE